MLDEAEMPPELWREMVELYAFCLPEGEQLISYPVPGRDNDTAVGRRAYNIIWYRPTDPATLADICTDADGRHHAAGIPPPLIRPDVIARVKADAKALIAPQIAEIFARTTPFFQPIYDLDFAAAWCSAVSRWPATRPSSPGPMPAPAPPRRRSMRPVLPTGSRDAGGDLAAGLKNYERMQLPFGASFGRGQSRGRRLSVSAQIKPKAERTAAELHRDIGEVLHAHIARSDQMGEIVASHGLTGLY